ncbi:MAG: hypothetical protein WBI20_14845 [Burkholderiaceae bacterium]
MSEIQTLYADGMIGNGGLLNALGQLTTGVFNYIRSESAPAYKLHNVMGAAHDYVWPPLSEADKKQASNNALSAFVSNLTGGKHG